MIKCFKRIRINKNRSNKELESLFAKKEDIKSQIAKEKDDTTNNKEQLEEDLENVCDTIAALCREKNKELAKDYLGKLNDPIEGFNYVQVKCWKLY